MTGVNSGEIRVAGSGHIYKAPLGSTLPATSSATWDTAFVDLGYAADGFDVAQDLKTTDINAWQTLEVVRIIANELNRTFTFTLQQTNADTLALAWGGATITPGSAGAYTLDVPGADAGLASYVFGLDWFDGETSQRIIIPNGTLTALPQIKFNRSGAVEYAITVRAVKPPTGASVQVLGVDLAVAPSAG